MCGVAGFFDFRGDLKHNASSLMDDMLASIKHRGPDDQGAIIGDWFGLGHVRLSILDPSPLGHQPMLSPDGRYILVYNGEIYNFHLLRAELLAKGYSFKSQSDSEVVLFGLIEWGAAFLKRLEGMFAGAFMDTHTQECLLFRDHLGIKPLYFVQNDNRLVFASEVKALWHILGKPSLNHEALYEQFMFRIVSGNRTLYQDVQRLLPGHYLRVRKTGACDLVKFYAITDHIHDHPRGKISLQDTAHYLNASIHAHTLSDVGFAVQLSGGIDSSYITHVLSREKQDLEAYSITLPGLREDEGEHQKYVAQKCGITLHQFPCTSKEFADLLPEVTRHLDFPIMHGGDIFLYHLCRQISKKHKVVLTGEGADELLAGYTRYKISALENISFKLKNIGLSEKMIPDLPKFRALKNLLKRNLGIEAGAFDMPIMHEIMNARGDAPYRTQTASGYKTLYACMMATDQTSYLQSLLERQDKISMAHGLEARVPFCTPALFEKFNMIDYGVKCHPEPKAILKNIMLYDFPQDFVYRRKNGFKLPYDLWLRDSHGLGRYLDDLKSAEFKNFSFINHKKLDAIIDAHIKGNINHAKELWALITFAVWAKQTGIQT